MKKYFIALACISLLFINQFVFAEQQKPINHNNVIWDNGKFPSESYLYLVGPSNELEYIEKQNIIVFQDKNRIIVDFWIIDVYTDDMQKQLDVTDRFGLDDQAAIRAKYTKTHYKITNDRFLSFIGVNLYDGDNNIMTGFSSGLDYKWEDIATGTYGETIYNAVFDYLNLADAIFDKYKQYEK